MPAEGGWMQSDDRSAATLPKDNTLLRFAAEGIIVSRLPKRGMCP